MDVKEQVIQATAVVLSAVAGDSSATRWRVRIVEFGPDANGINWDKASLTAALHLFDGAKVFALKDSQHVEKDKKFGKPITELVGAISNPAIEADGVYGDLVILPSGSWVADDLKACEEHKIPYVYGLSVDIRATTKKTTVGGKTLIAPLAIKSVQVDVVHDPAAGGEFLTQLAAARQAEKEDQMLQKLLAALQGKRQDLHQQITAGMADGSITEDQAAEMIVAALASETVKDAGGDAGNEKLVAAVAAGFKEAFAGAESDELKKMQLINCGMTLDRELQAAGLPAKAEESLRAQFGNRMFDTATLQAAIKNTKELIDDVTGSGRVVGVGHTRIVRDTSDKLQAACDKMFGLDVPDEVKDVAPFKSIRAAYVELTGDTEVRGYIDDPAALRRLQAAGFDSGTFQFVLGNTLYRRLITDYNEITDYGVSLLVGGNIRNARDFRSLQSVRIAYFGDLPAVDPENDQDYADLGTLSDEKIDYTLGQKGGIITISRKMIINDDIRAVDTIRRRLPRAARRTLAKSVWAHLINNVVYQGDSKAIFHTDHNNLDTTAFGMTAVLGMKSRLYGQTEPGSGEVLGLDLKTLVIPQALWGAAVTLNQTPNFLIATVQTGNPFFQYFGQNNERIISIPFMTDATDFFGLADAGEAEIIELAFLNGQQEPEMFVADNPNFGQFFVGDRIQYKIRHEYSSAPTDFRGVQKSVVAG
jgi:hypothetical protein